MKWTLTLGLVSVSLLSGQGCASERRDQPVTPDDVRILLRADELLKDESVWNRNDDRECEDDEATGKRSLFCALHRASIDILGAYDHRRVALQEVRFAVEDATSDQDSNTGSEISTTCPRPDLPTSREFCVSPRIG